MTRSTASARPTSLLLLASVVGLSALGACTRSRTPQAGDMTVVKMSEVVTVGNATCPVSNKPVAGKPEAPSFYSVFQGHKVGFMCPVCKGTFDSATAAEKRVLLDRALKISGKAAVPSAP